MATVPLTDTLVLRILENPKARMHALALQAAYEMRYVQVAAGCCGKTHREVNPRAMHNARMAIGGMSPINLRNLRRVCNMPPSDVWVFTVDAGGVRARKFQV